MDLKGSLVDGNLKIYPSRKLLIFLEKLSTDDEIPGNILQFVKLKDIKPNQELDIDSASIQLNNSDINSLKQIKETVYKAQKNKTIEEPNIVPNSILKKDSNEKNIENIEDRRSSESESKDEDISEDREVPHLSTSDINWLYIYLQKKRSQGEKDIPYLHMLLEGACVTLPENAVIKRNPVLEARCVKLRAQQEAREYRKMTKGVDNVRIRYPEDSISYQLKQINRQMIAIGQFIISIFAGFLFGFKGVEWILGPLDFGFRLLLGVMCALVIALAEIYFLAKKLNEEMNVAEPVQLGGPVKFDSERNKTMNNSVDDKEHQD